MGRAQLFSFTDSQPCSLGIIGRKNKTELCAIGRTRHYQKETQRQSCGLRNLYKPDMEKKLLLQDGDYSIWRHNGIPDDALIFLDSIAWGNDGAVYEHKNTETHIRLLHQPTLMAINEKEKIQGTAVFCNTPVSVGTSIFNCYYIRYFAASNEIKGKGVMKKYAVKVSAAFFQKKI